MKICLISVEIFAWGKYGGFGRATRIIGRELVKRGFEVSAVVPLRKDQQPIENLDGINVYGFPPFLPWKARKPLINCNADIYHSCEPSHTSYLALNALPHKKHMVTLRDPRDLKDWKIEFMQPTQNKWQVMQNYIFENNYLVRKSIKQMDAVYTAAKCLIPKVRHMYGLGFNPGFLPTPVSIKRDLQKAKTPMVCYLARLDRRKRPTLFLDLAEKFPHVLFFVMGQSRDKKWEAYLRTKYKNIPNLEFKGFVDQFRSIEHSQILEQSWIMVNTASREGLPNAFLESAASKCAILSYVNPDGFASQFGYHAKNNDFAKGLEFLLEADNWRKRGERGYDYVKNTFETDLAIKRHIDIYSQILKDKSVHRSNGARA